ncbi:MAG: YiiX/YebB-like N1pC/P60 family cysteine hydrolase [bacterium]
MKQFVDNISHKVTEWLMKDSPPPTSPLCDFERLRFELRLGDVVLMEGRSRVAEVIKLVTQSPWSHSALYIGRVFDIRDPKLRVLVEAHYEGDPEDQLILEALMGEGTIVSPLSKYRDMHMRICRPDGLSPQDAQKVVGHAVRKLGLDYDVRQVLDLARFFFPWGILPRRWRSSLFQHNAGEPTQTVCSTLIAEAFNAVDFPILPFIDRNQDGSLRFFKRNPRLMSPSDFDYSPYFNIIKYPYLGMNDIGLYRRLPWHDDSVFHDDEHPGKKLATDVALDVVAEDRESESALHQGATGTVTHFPFSNRWKER